MAVSGHKSIQSLAIYQKTDNKKKIEMGKQLSASVIKSPNNMIEYPKEIPALPAPPATLAVQKNVSESAIAPTTSAPIVPYEANFEQDDGSF